MKARVHPKLQDARRFPSYGDIYSFGITPDMRYLAGKTIEVTRNRYTPEGYDGCGYSWSSEWLIIEPENKQLDLFQ